MTKHLSRIELRRIVVNLDEFFPVRTDVKTKSTTPFSKRDEGRFRRNERRQAIARKREFLTA